MHSLSVWSRGDLVSLDANVMFSICCFVLSSPPPPWWCRNFGVLLKLALSIIVDPDFFKLVVG